MCNQDNNTRMTTIRIIMLFLGLIFFFCNQAQTTSRNVIIQDTIPQRKSISDILIDIKTGLFNEALTSDSVEFLNFMEEFELYECFLFFKSGYIINETEKNALVVTCPTDTTYTVEFYSLQKDCWNFIDSISDLDISYIIQFDVTFDDYNFDGQTDLYIQTSVSNGWALSMGHLIIINPKTKKLELHKEASEFASMTPDRNTQTVKSEWVGDYDKEGRQRIIFTNKWINGQLKTTNKKQVLIEINSDYQDD